jgi:hypothetical protein
MMRLKWLCLGVLATAGLACEGAEPAAPGSLLDVPVPADFTFATSRGLTVRAVGDAARIAATLAEVRLPDGALVHRGPLAAPVELAVATAVTELQVTLHGGGASRTVTVPVVGAEAQVVVE